MPTWDAQQYLRHADARTRPAGELLARVAAPDPGLVVDIGCGPGNSTALLADRWPEATVIGVDASAEMVAHARRAHPGVEFIQHDLMTWDPPAPVDVVFSNATLHWLGDHPAVFDRLLKWRGPGGVLAVQMPANFDQPSHTLMRSLAASRRWRSQLEGVLVDDPVASPEGYFRMVAAVGRRVDIWTTEYLQVLEGEDPVLDWVRGTALRPVLDRLGTSEAEEFVAEYRIALRSAYPRRADGTTLFPFRRVFIVVSG